MWKVVYVVSTKLEALKIEKELTDKGFLIDVVATNDDFQVKVPESEASDVYDYIINNMR